MALTLIPAMVGLIFIATYMFVRPSIPLRNVGIVLLTMTVVSALLDLIGKPV